MQQRKKVAWTWIDTLFYAEGRLGARHLPGKETALWKESKLVAATLRLGILGMLLLHVPKHCTHKVTPSQ